ncbi:MAG TPA: hypothetical protein VNT23_08620 [Gaiellaceae bacterium]|nr:hypothetical protein [Gaiellaceae bacterium]
MRRVSYVVVFALTAIAGGFAAVFVAGSAESAPPAPKGVVKVQEQNTTANGAVRVAQQGVAAITIHGTPTFRLDPKELPPLEVRQAPREQFQQFIEATGQDGCGAVRVPEGRRLTIESFVADALSTGKPTVHLRSRVVHADGSTSFGSSILLTMAHVGESLWSGHATTLLFSGPTAPDADAFVYEACLSGGSFLRATVSGYLD